MNMANLRMTRRSSDGSIGNWYVLRFRPIMVSGNSSLKVKAATSFHGLTFSGPMMAQIVRLSRENAEMTGRDFVNCALVKTWR